MLCMMLKREPYWAHYTASYQKIRSSGILIDDMSKGVSWLRLLGLMRETEISLSIRAK
jgi:hypothetical protein